MTTGSVPGSKLQTNSVSFDRLTEQVREQLTRENAVIADGSITTPKIADEAVTISKLDQALQDSIATGEVNTFYNGARVSTLTLPSDYQDWDLVVLALRGIGVTTRFEVFSVAYFAEVAGDSIWIGPNNNDWIRWTRSSRTINFIPGAPASGRWTAVRGYLLSSSNTGGSGTSNFTGSVGTSQIDDGAVTLAKLASDVIARIDSASSGGGPISIGPGSITSTELATGAVTSVKINDEAVNESKLATNAVTSSKLADGAVSETKLATPVADKLNNPLGRINDGAIDGDKLTDGSVDEAKLSTAAQTKLNASGITTAEVQQTVRTEMSDADNTVNASLGANPLSEVDERITAAIPEVTDEEEAFFDGAFTHLKTESTDAIPLNQKSEVIPVAQPGINNRLVNAVSVAPDAVQVTNQLDGENIDEDGYYSGRVEVRAPSPAANILLGVDIKYDRSTGAQNLFSLAQSVREDLDDDRVGTLSPSSAGVFAEGDHLNILFSDPVQPDQSATYTLTATPEGGSAVTYTFAGHNVEQPYAGSDTNEWRLQAANITSDAKTGDVLDALAPTSAVSMTLAHPRNLHRRLAPHRPPGLQRQAAGGHPHRRLRRGNPVGAHRLGRVGGRRGRPGADVLGHHLRRLRPPRRDRPHQLRRLRQLGA